MLWLWIVIENQQDNCRISLALSFNCSLSSQITSFIFLVKPSPYQSKNQAVQIVHDIDAIDPSDDEINNTGNTKPHQFTPLRYPTASMYIHLGYIKCSFDVPKVCDCEQINPLEGAGMGLELPSQEANEVYILTYPDRRLGGEDFRHREPWRLHRVVNIHSLEGLRQSQLFFSRKCYRVMLHTHILHICSPGRMPSACTMFMSLVPCSFQLRNSDDSSISHNPHNRPRASDLNNLLMPAQQNAYHLSTSLSSTKGSTADL